MIKTDFLVIGSGIAGLSFALKAAIARPDLKVTIVTKANASESNTKYAQGGIAVVWNIEDSFEKHIEDTLRAGDGLCDPEVVELVVKNGPKRLREFIQWGASFDETNAGDYDLGMEGGHSENRIIHHKDVTGLEMERTLLGQIQKQENITLLTHHFAIDLITEHQISRNQAIHWKEKHCYGVYVQDETSGKIETLISRVTMLATGGAGQVYRTTTNPLIATGDGIAMAYRAKAQIKDLEFVQFHPTALFGDDENPAFLISEAVRGMGAILRTKSGEAFMHKYDERKELASRDIVAKAIDQEMKIRGDKHVYLDCTHIDPKAFADHFPNILAKCEQIGLDLTQDWIPVAPAAHYMCGGVVVDQRGRTSVDRLYACGECSRTGLHGANRLASNSLLEAIVFAEESINDALARVDEISIESMSSSIPEWDSEGTTSPKEHILIAHNRNELRDIMSDYVGIVRSNERLKRAANRLELLYLENKELYERSIISPQLCELRNLITVSYNLVRESRKRTENRGGFYNIDLV